MGHFGHFGHLGHGGGSGGVVLVGLFFIVVLILATRRS